MKSLHISEIFSRDKASSFFEADFITYQNSFTLFTVLKAYASRKKNI